MTHKRPGGYCDRCGTYQSPLIRDGYREGLLVCNRCYLPYQTDCIDPIVDDMVNENARPEPYFDETEAVANPYLVNDPLTPS